ncbi:hypothetical protein [Amycolatopsis sp. NPDC059657]|uniref:hypothetical protein n=1 Tax=Amycolatopsis sp. NPDC059657 TaxID=3346899 RepID=UPI00366B9A41
MRSVKGIALAAVVAAGLVAMPGAEAIAADGPAIRASDIRFHTNDDDKDYDTNVRIDVVDRYGTVAAHLEGVLGLFKDNTDNGPFSLTVQNPSATKETVRGGTLKIHLDTVGRDEWRFNLNLIVRFEDNSTLGSRVNGIRMSHKIPDGTWGIG